MFQLHVNNNNHFACSIHQKSHWGVGGGGGGEGVSTLFTVGFPSQIFFWVFSLGAFRFPECKAVHHGSHP